MYKHGFVWQELHSLHPHSASSAFLCESLCDFNGRISGSAWNQQSAWQQNYSLFYLSFYPRSLLLLFPSFLFLISCFSFFSFLPPQAADLAFFTPTTCLFYFDPCLLLLLHFPLFCLFWMHFCFHISEKALRVCVCLSVCVGGVMMLMFSRKFGWNSLPCCNSCGHIALHNIWCDHYVVISCRIF